MIEFINTKVLFNFPISDSSFPILELRVGYFDWHTVILIYFVFSVKVVVEMQSSQYVPTRHEQCNWWKYDQTCTLYLCW